VEALLKVLGRNNKVKSLAYKFPPEYVFIWVDRKLQYSLKFGNILQSGNPSPHSLPRAVHSVLSSGACFPPIVVIPSVI
jgi:hypothetical protein